MSAVLGIVTAGPVAAAVVSDGGEFAAESGLQALRGTLVCVIEALHKATLTLDDIALIAVCTGPGSFTGLRIGVALAKSIAQARGIALAGVSSYDVATAAHGEAGYASIVEGKRGFYYVRFRGSADGEYRYASGSEEALEEPLRGLRRFALRDVPAAEQALRVARAGRRMGAPRTLAWQDVFIDYGQRSNAEMNWEGRVTSKRRVGPAKVSKSTG